MADVRLPSGDLAPMLVRYEDVQAVLACPHSSRRVVGAGRPRMVAGTGIDDVPGVLINMDAPEHTRLRRILQGWAEAFLSTSDLSAEARHSANQAFVAYAGRLVAERRRAPGDALIDLMIRARDDDDRLREDELVNMVFTMLVAGFESSALMTTRGVYRLLHTGQFAELCANPSLLRPAVEEILRFDGPGTYGLLRLVTEDAAIPSGTIPGGTVVLPNLAAANHDPGTFSQPDRFDIRRFRDGAPYHSHLAFGHGPHHCLGANLARMELQEAIRALVTRKPGLRPAIPLHEVTWSAGGLNHRPAQLPVYHCSSERS